MTSKEIIDNFFKFYSEKDHKMVPNVSLIPENDPTLLYVNSGMFPLVPYLSGQPHPLGKRIMNVQRCLRFNEDIDNVGVTNRHTTAFHMLGNWSLGDYFKKEQLPNVFKYYVEVLGLDINRLYASVFEGDKDAPKDEESIKILQEIYKSYGLDAKEGERIFAYGKKENWWQRGDAIGELGGPDSEVFYYIGDKGDGFGLNPYDHENDFLEMGSSVFMQYVKTQNGWEELPQKNVDYGGGLERQALVVQGKTDIFETDNFYPIIQTLEKLTKKSYTESPEIKRSMRVISDHIRSAVFLAMDGVIPSNKDQGYILRQLIRRMVRQARALELTSDVSGELVSVACFAFDWLYQDLKTKAKSITKTFLEEEQKFKGTLEKGSKHVAKLIKTVKDDAALLELAFSIYTSFGYPIEFYIDDLKRAEITFDEAKLLISFKQKILNHKSLSKAGAEQKFKGGLAEHSEQNKKYHTATHLLQMALRKVLGNTIFQQGSNITGERLRFDFNFERKLNANELKEVEEIVNDAIKSNLPVKFIELDKEEALATEALHNFMEKYGERVTIYYIGKSLEEAISKEFCGGPHVTNTSEIGRITLYKQEGLGAGKVRIYAK